MTEMTSYKIEYIRQRTNLEGSELGETWALLIELYQYRTYLTDDLIKALEKELELTYEDLDKNWRVKETKEITEHWVKELVPKTDPSL